MLCENIRMKLPDAYLSRREQQILEVLYREGPLTAAELTPFLPGSPGNSTVRKLLSILEERGHLVHEEDGPRYVYRPAWPKQDAGMGALQHAVETFFAGSMTNTVAALLTGGGKISPEELSEIEALIERAKREEGK
jgi:predicted transcriptional regulator